MIDGPGRQQSPIGGVASRYFSSSARVRGRWLIQMWSWESTATPENSPNDQLFGRLFGQAASNSNTGTPGLCVRAALTASSVSTPIVHMCLAIKLRSEAESESELRRPILARRGAQVLRTVLLRVDGVVRRIEQVEHFGDGINRDAAAEADALLRAQIETLAHRLREVVPRDDGAVGPQPCAAGRAEAAQIASVGGCGPFAAQHEVQPAQQKAPSNLPDA